jgi:very-short-patch-repair endonuclease
MRWTEDDLKAFAARHKAFKGVDIDAVHKKRETPQESKLERRFVQQLYEAGINGYLRGYFFLEDRDFELDFAWPQIRAAVEVQGMAHRIKGKFKRDIEKRALAMFAGWRVLEVDGESIRSGRAIEWTRKLLSL